MFSILNSNFKLPFLKALNVAEALKPNKEYPGGGVLISTNTSCCVDGLNVKKL